MRNELITRLLPQVKRHIVCDALIFVESKKYNNVGRPKSLYLVFAAKNIGTGLCQSVTYDVVNEAIDIRMHRVVVN